MAFLPLLAGGGRKVRTAEHMVPRESEGVLFSSEDRATVRATVTNRVAPGATTKLLGDPPWWVGNPPSCN